MSEDRAVWVTRPEPASARTAKALKKAGFLVVTLPVLRVTHDDPEPVPDDAPDWIVLVSGNALAGLEAALDPWEKKDVRALRERARVAAVGEATAKRAGKAGWSVTLTAPGSTARSLVDAFAESDLDGTTVWIPTGNRAGSATELLPEALGERGARVLPFRVYRTLDRTPGDAGIAQLDAHRPGWIVYHSPSAVDAVAALRLSAVERWRLEASAVAIGPVTAARAKEQGGAVLIATAPGDEELVQLLQHAVSGGRG